VDLGGPINIVDHALNHFVENGKRRLVAIFPSGIEACRIDYFRSAVEQRGISCPPCWMHGIDVVQSHWVDNVLELIFAGSPETRPDSILITDDNLFDSVHDSLVRLGIHPKDDVLIVTHSNFPARTKCIPGVVRVGYDISSVLHSCMNLIDAQAQQKRVEMQQIFSPVFEWEAEAAKRDAAQTRARNRPGKKTNG
jgi:DNA-binding LacI/PurR family transcriptional regulator